MYRLVTFHKPPAVANAGDVGMDGKLFAKLFKPVNELNPWPPKQLVELIHGCMAYKPDKRPADMQSITEILEPLEKKLIRSPDDGLKGLEW